MSGISRWGHLVRAVFLLYLGWVLRIYEQMCISQRVSSILINNSGKIQRRHGGRSKRTSSITSRTQACTSSLPHIPSLYSHSIPKSSVYRLVRENNVPGVYIPYAPFLHRLFVWTPRYFRVASADPETKEEVNKNKNGKGPLRFLEKGLDVVRDLFGFRPREAAKKWEEKTVDEKAKEDWMSPMRIIAEETYKHLMDAIATYVFFFPRPSSIHYLYSN
jgi:hypothetical protein